MSSRHLLLAAILCCWHPTRLFMSFLYFLSARVLSAGLHSRGLQVSIATSYDISLCGDPRKITILANRTTLGSFVPIPPLSARITKATHELEVSLIDSRYSQCGRDRCVPDACNYNGKRASHQMPTWTLFMSVATWIPHEYVTF